MPYLASRSPSPLQSPTQMAMGNPMGNPVARKVSLTSMKANTPMTYIPPLIDGACGTVLRAEQPTAMLFWEDVKAMVKAGPVFFQSLWNQVLCSGKKVSWADVVDVAAHVALALLELTVMVNFIPLFLFLPGFFLVIWSGFCLMLIAGLSRVVNGKNRVIRCAAGSDGWMMGQESEDERWIYVGGMELSTRHLSISTLPMLSKLFSRSFTAISTPTYGIPFDLIAMLLHRNTTIPSETTRILYSQIRAALLDPTINRVVILSHNLGSLPVSKATSQLFSDLPADKLSKLEIYTFGAVSSEFILPTGDTKDIPGSPVHIPSSMDFRRTNPPHIEHFALSTDPFAQLGVLRSTKENLETRFCGGVFVISSSTTTPTTESAPSPPTGLTLASYLTALFPTQLTGGQLNDSILDTIMTIDRDVAEKREFAAMNNFAAARAERGGKKERLSWTALGAMAAQNRVNGVMEGVAGLEMARKGCRNCDGHRGREVSWLVRYVNVGCIEGAIPGLGMNGMSGMNGVAGTGSHQGINSIHGVNGVTNMNGFNGTNGIIGTNAMNRLNGIIGVRRVRHDEANGESPRPE